MEHTHTARRHTSQTKTLQHIIEHSTMAAVMGAASASDTGNACKRLQKELMALMMNTDDGISAFPDSDNMLNW